MHGIAPSTWYTYVDSQAPVAIHIILVVQFNQGKLPAVREKDMPGGAHKSGTNLISFTLLLEQSECKPAKYTA